jgi:SPP1 gp7 family putative phage head morphogenesis protein
MELADAIIRHSLELQRVSRFEEDRAEQVLIALERELRALVNSRTLSTAGKREIEAIIRQAQEAISGRYANIAGILDAEAIAQHVADRTLEAMQTMFPSAAAPTAETIRSLSRDILIDGAPSSAWWAKQSDDTAFKFSAAIRRGVINGQTNEQIVRAVAGDLGVIGVARRNARSLVHTSVMTAANQARLATFRKNSKFARGLRWLSTLDSRTCMRCAALDGQEWDFEGKAIDRSDGGALTNWLRDIGVAPKALDFQVPPAHINCRCVVTIIPGRTALDEAFPGLADKLEATRDRATPTGPQKVTMSEWLQRNPAAAEEILGKRRVEMFQAGKLSLTDLVTKSGRAKSLAEL